MRKDQTKEESNLELILKQFFIKRVFHIVIFLLCVTFFLIYFLLFIPEDTIHIETMRNVSNTKLREVSITTFDTDMDNSFISFNGCIYLYDEDMYGISADVFMPIPGHKYYDNIIGYEQELNNSECLLSKNIMYERHLNIGDELYLRDSDVVYTIKGALPSCIGIDEKYEHTGNIVLAYNEELISYFSSYTYVTFLESIDGFSDSSGQIYLENMSNRASKSLAIDISIYIAILLATIVIGELLSYNMRYMYKDAVFDGVKSSSVFLLILKDMFIKYYMPFVLSILICMVAFSLYSINYLILVSGAFALLFGISMIVGIIYFRRNY